MPRDYISCADRNQSGKGNCRKQPEPIPEPDDVIDALMDAYLATPIRSRLAAQMLERLRMAWLERECRLLRR